MTLLSVRPSHRRHPPTGSNVVQSHRNDAGFCDRLTGLSIGKSDTRNEVPIAGINIKVLSISEGNFRIGDRGLRGVGRKGAEPLSTRATALPHVW